MKQILAIVAVLIVGYATSSPVQAQGMGPFEVHPCSACRDPYRFPRDYRNFAFNSVFGPDRFLSLGQGDFFFVENPAGDIVGVDINMDIEFLTVNFGLPFTVPWPVGYEVQIVLNLDNGDQLPPYTIEPRAYSATGLPVGGRGGGGGGGPGGPGGGGGSGPPGSGPPGTGGGGRICGYTSVDGGKRRRTCI